MRINTRYINSTRGTSSKFSFVTSRVSSVAASESSRAGYDQTYTTRVPYFAVTHSDPLCSIYMWVFIYIYKMGLYIYIKLIKIKEKHQVGIKVPKFSADALYIYIREQI